MKLDGEYTFDHSVEDVWEALFDPAVLAAVMPGCEKLELVDGAYVGEIKVKVGPIQGKFAGKVDLLDIARPSSYRMIVDGRGAQGFVKANASITLVPDGDKTKVVYTSDAQVGGKIATVGQRLVETSAKAIVRQSLEGLAENIKIRVDAYRAHAAAVQPAPAVPIAATEIDVPAFQMPAKTVEPAATTAALAAETEAATATETMTPVAETATAVAASTAMAAASETTAPTVVDRPVVQYKQADAGKMAGAVAKEVGKTLAPMILGAIVVVAVIIYLLIH